LPRKTFEAAWVACAFEYGCGFIHKGGEGRYYLRRSTDPDITQGSGMIYNCPIGRPPPTLKPTPMPTIITEVPTPMPTSNPVPRITKEPTGNPSGMPTTRPSGGPSPSPTDGPSPEPTPMPTMTPSHKPTAKPTQKPTRQPTLNPTHKPTAKPTQWPTPEPTPTPTIIAGIYVSAPIPQECLTDLPYENGIRTLQPGDKIMKALLNVTSIYRNLRLMWRVRDTTARRMARRIFPRTEWMQIGDMNGDPPVWSRNKFSHYEAVDGTPAGGYHKTSAMYSQPAN